LSFASKSFNIVLASEMVEHLWDPHGFFDEVYGALKPAGYMIVETPEGREGLHYDSHKSLLYSGLVKTNGWKKIYCGVS
jgi:2-polyprenyl-3-methyl-5-hydroxy-6-metoxy-1,4-benzoquinol methylase